MEDKKARVLDVGQCNPDHGMLRAAIERDFDAEVDRVMFIDDAVEAMRKRQYDLVLVNRLIFEDGSDGAELIRRAKQDPPLADVPIMLISNFADARRRAVEAGGVEGFGKDDLKRDTARARLAEYLPAKS